MINGINEVAVLTTSLLSVAVGSIWYSPFFFGEQWIRSAGLNPQDLIMSPRQIATKVVVAVFANIVLFLVLAWFIRSVKVQTLELMHVGVALVLLLGAVVVSMTMWEGRSWQYTIIHSGYAAIVIFGGLGILAYWPW